MSKYLVIFDPHAQNNPEEKLKTHQQLMRETSEIALELKCDNVICAGDLWHEKYGVNTEVLSMVYNELEWAHERDMSWILLRGNHEIASKLHPNRTLLRLFSHVAEAVIEPKILAGADHQLFMLPWYLADRFIEYARKLAAVAQVSTVKHKILISHIGLNEGSLSASNYYRVPQRVSINHLRANAYNLVLLGDYHQHQVLSPKVMYGGAPIQLAFGDEPDQGLWLLDLTGDRAKISNVPLRKEYPRYITTRVEQGGKIPDALPGNYYRVQAHVEDLAKFEAVSPDRMVFDPYGSREIDDTERRLAHVEGDDPIDLFRACLEYKRIEKMEYYQMGEHAIKRAMTALYGK